MSLHLYTKGGEAGLLDGAEAEEETEEEKAARKAAAEERRKAGLTATGSCCDWSTLYD